MSNQIPSITPGKANGIAKEKDTVILLDVRTPSEFWARRAVGARNIPLDILPTALASDKIPKNATICVLCEKGGRAAIAAEQLVKAGHGDVHVVAGGTEHVGSHAVLAALGFVPTRKAEVDQGIQIGVCHSKHMAATTTVATIGAAKFLVLFMPERDAPGPAVSSRDIDIGFVNELHGVAPLAVD